MLKEKVVFEGFRNITVGELFNRYDKTGQQIFREDYRSNNITDTLEAVIYPIIDQWVRITGNREVLRVTIISIEDNIKKPSVKKEVMYLRESDGGIIQLAGEVDLL